MVNVKIHGSSQAEGKKKLCNLKEPKNQTRSPVEVQVKYESRIEISGKRPNYRELALYIMVALQKVLGQIGCVCKSMFSRVAPTTPRRYGILIGRVTLVHQS